MKRAVIFKFEDKYIIHSESTTTDGYGIATEPYIIMDAASTMKDAVEKLLEAMGASRTDIIDSKSDTFLKEYLKSIGLKTHKDLYKQSISCLAYEKEDKIAFLPSINMGLRGGFKHRPDRKVEVLSNASMEDKCNALVEALSRCE